MTDRPVPYDAARHAQMTVISVPYDDARHRHIVRQAAKDYGEMNLSAIAEALRRHGISQTLTPGLDKAITEVWKELGYWPLTDKKN